MIIVDTSVWIEFLKANESYFSRMKDLLEQRNVLGIECIFGELLQGVKNNREKKIINDYWNYIPKINESGCWIKAGVYSQENNHISKGVGLIDSFIIVIGKLTESEIWTIDKKLLSTLEEKYTYVL